MRNFLIEGSAEPFRQIVAASADAIVGIDTSHRIVIFNEAAETMFGMTCQDAIGRLISVLIPEEFRAAHSSHVDRFQSGEPKSQYMGDRKNHLKALRADGSTFPAAATIMSLKTETGPLMVAHLRDISERMALVEEQTRLASLDPLTGALNRRAFFERSEFVINQNTNKKTKYAVLLMDLDNFKIANDQFGHAAGDEVLRAFSDVCKSALRSDDTFARWGGEEFLALLPVSDISAGVEIAERIRRQTEKHAFKLQGQEPIRQTVSIGAAQSQSEPFEMHELIVLADTALYAAKAAGRNCVKFFDSAMETQQKKTA